MGADQSRTGRRHSDDHSRYGAVGHCPPPGHRADCAGGVPRRRDLLRRSGIHPDRHSTAWSSPPACPAARAAATTWKPSCAAWALTSWAAWALSRRTASRTTPDPGKVERFQQTLKKWLRARPRQPATPGELQTLLDAFTSIYNTWRPHRSLPHRATPATAYAAPEGAGSGAGAVVARLGIAATLAANVAHGLGHGLADAAVAACPAVALAGSHELLMLIIRNAQAQPDAALAPGCLTSIHSRCKPRRSSPGTSPTVASFGAASGAGCGRRPGNV